MPGHLHVRGDGLMALGDEAADAHAEQLRRRHHDAARAGIVLLRDELVRREEQPEPGDVLGIGLAVRGQVRLVLVDETDHGELQVVSEAEPNRLPRRLGRGRISVGIHLLCRSCRTRVSNRG